MTDVLDDLQWRGLIAQHTDIEALRDALSAGPVTYYCGFDPTAPSLHHGHLVQLIVMRHLQQAGHRPLALVGGATGLIGDPRMSGERTLNPADVVATWSDKLRGQIEPFLDFEGDNGATMVNNLDWTAGVSAIEFLRDVGKHFRLSNMLAKDNVARRLQSDEGISYTEFSYQILQAQDFLNLFRTHGCTLQTGGNDQWGNLTAGLDLIRRTEGEHVHVMTTPLITKSDGTKFGKSEGGAIWLDAELLSPYAFFQFWLGVEDADVVRFLKVFTFLSREDIEHLAEQVASKPQARQAQRVLAREVTGLVHGAGTTRRVEEASKVLFGRGDPATIDEATLADAVAELPRATASLGDSLTDVLVSAGLEKGRNAALRTLRGGGASVNNRKIEDVDYVLDETDALPGKRVLIKKGRKNMVVVDLTA